MENTLKIKVFRKSIYFFANISATEARIFMKFYMVVNYYLVNLSFKFHEDLNSNARARVINARTRDKTRVRVYNSYVLIYARIFIKFET